MRAAWWELEPGPTGRYLVAHAVEFLTAAGHVEQAVLLAGDLRFIACRISQHGAAAAIADLDELGRAGADGALAKAADLKRIAYLLEGPENALHSTLLAYLGPLP